MAFDYNNNNKNLTGSVGSDTHLKALLALKTFEN
jgi:hypothetical protein